MLHGCFISYKKCDRKYADAIAFKLRDLGYQVKYLDEWLEEDNPDSILETIRKKYMSGTSVTLFLIGDSSFESTKLNSKHQNEQYFIIRELQATLFDRKNNPRDGLIGIVLPDASKKVFTPKSGISLDGKIRGCININDKTVIKEFSQNFWMGSTPNYNLDESERYAVLCRYCEFVQNASIYIDRAYSKRKANIEVKYKGIEHKGLPSLK